MSLMESAHNNAGHPGSPPPNMNSSTPSRFLRLPGEVVLCIADFCSPDSLLSLIRCNKYLHDLLYEFLRRLGTTAYGGRAVLWAAAAGKLEILQFLHRRGAPVLQHWYYDGELSSYHREPVYSEAFFQEFIFKAAPDPQRHGLHISPMLIASVHANVDVVSWLLDNGADANDTCLLNKYDSGLDALCLVIVNLTHWTTTEDLIEREVATVKVLLDHGARTVEETEEGPGEDDWSALPMAVSYSALHIAELLLERGSRPYDAIDARYGGFTPLGLILLRTHDAPRQMIPDCSCFPTSIESGGEDCEHMRFLRLLLTAGASLTTPVSSDPAIFPLHCAILEGSYGAFREILAAGADPNLPSREWLPLHCAFNPSDYGHPFEDIDGPEVYKRRWQHWRGSRPKVVKELLAAGADPNSRACRPNNTLDVTFSSDDPDLLTGGYTPLMYAAANGRCPESMLILIDGGADINAIDTWKQNALHWAIMGLCELDIQQEGYLKEWNEAMGERQDVKIFELLLERGCNPAQKNEEGECVLQLLPGLGSAHEKTQEGLLRVLLDHLSDDCVREGCFHGLVESYLRTKNFDGIRIIEHAFGSRGLGIFTATDTAENGASMLLRVCLDYPLTDRFADDLLDYFGRVSRFAERNGLIHLSQAEEEDGPGRELRIFLLEQEERAVGFIMECPCMFPQLFPTVTQPGDTKVDAAGDDVGSMEFGV